MASATLRQSSKCMRCTRASMTSGTHQSARRYYILTSLCSHALIPKQHCSPATQIPLSHSSLQRRSFGISPSTSIPKFSIPSEAMEAVKQTVAQNMGIKGAHELVPEDQQFTLEQTPDLSGKVAVITGALCPRPIGKIAALTANRRLRRYRLRRRIHLPDPQYRQNLRHLRL